MENTDATVAALTMKRDLGLNAGQQAAAPGSEFIAPEPDTGAQETAVKAGIATKVEPEAELMVSEAVSKP